MITSSNISFDQTIMLNVQAKQVKYLGLTMNEHVDWDLYSIQLKKETQL